MLIVTAVLMAGCSGPQGRAPRDAPPGEAESRGAPTRVTAAIMGDANTAYQKLNPSSTVPGIDTLQQLVHAGLTVADDQGALRPQLAAAVPSLENGRWVLFPGGRMQTSWEIRPAARWHDGAPFTSDDLVFTAALVQDPQLLLLREPRFRFVESVSAPDPQTVVVWWTHPFIDADRLFTSDFAYPLPRHLLEREYAEARAGLLDLPYWSHEFVGTGPYRVRELVRGSHLMLEAFDDYVLGRPKIDSIEVRFIPDSNTLVANILAGVVELTLGRSISVEQGLQISERWPNGRAQVAASNLLRVFPQFINPDPPVIADVQFRRALLHAIDRQEMVDTLLFGVLPVAHSYLNPGQAMYRDVEERSVVRYEYDPRKAMQVIDGFGYRKGADGMYRDAGGQPLAVEILVSASQEINVKSTFAVADYWQRLGVGTKPMVEALQVTGLERRQFEATWPGFTLIRSSNDVAGFLPLHSSEARLPENAYNGSNRGRYMSWDLDGLIDRYFLTIPAGDRVEIVGQIIHHVSDQLPLLPLFYGAEPAAIAHRLSNVGTRPPGSTQAWNAHEWSVARAS